MIDEEGNLLRNVWVCGSEWVFDECKCVFESIVYEYVEQTWNTTQRVTSNEFAETILIW